MALVSVAIVSKDNRPLYLKDFREDGGGDSQAWGIGVGGTVSGIDASSADLFHLAHEASSDKAATAAAAVAPTEPLQASIGQSCSIQQQFILHSALDRMHQLCEPDGMGAAWRYGRTGQIGHEAMYVGLIGHVEDVRVYGYITTTKIKIIVAVEDAFLPGQTEQGKAHEVALKNLMIKIHGLYTEYIANPFTTLSANTIKSARFDNGVTANVNAFNRNPALTMR
mmetsp:Transcript_36053/g.78964  ORF Transcript_36053/g.78964 Transcript_36053/m.78964 type:complete len:224 (+) Transcript_36053:115-786(+)